MGVGSAPVPVVGDRQHPWDRMTRVRKRPAASPRTRVRRHPERADYDRTSIDAILDEALICHIGFVVEGSPG